MKTQLQKQWTKIACVAFVIFAMATVANAQTASGTDILKTAGKTNSGTAAPVRLVDNKGTIKYLQVNNGLTQIVNTTNEVTTTTWQLGGQLTENTYIDVNGKVFALDKLTLVTDATTASTDATSLSSHGTGTGWTVLIRDEASGALEKIKLSDLLQVQAGETTKTVDAAFITTPKITPSATTFPSDYAKVSVYRNGIKLLANTDYTVASGSATLVPNSTAPSDWVLNVGDVIEVHWIK